jgi:hypothetical protein
VNPMADATAEMHFTVKAQCRAQTLIPLVGGVEAN